MKHGMMCGTAVGLAIGAGLLAAAPASAQDANGSCAALSGKMLGDDGTIISSKAIAADAARHLPAYCEVHATLKPVPGSNIGVVYRLPEKWNGKVLGLGGGGWAGNVTLMAAAPGLARGYASAQTDGGHPGTSVWDTSWTSNPEARKDFAYRAIHEMTVAAKQIVQLNYGKPQTRTYYQGCSTGGRMGLMEAQRFPDDYDGIIAGAPVYTLQVQTSAILRNQMFSAPGAGFTAAQLAMVNAAVLKACDATDGQTDGIIGNPLACHWNPATIACKGGKASGQCLAPAQVKALETAYKGIRAPDGSWAALPLERGGEIGWSRFMDSAGTGKDATHGGGMMNMKTLLFGQTPVDFSAFRADKDVAVARSSDFARMYEAANPDLDAFVKHGGRLILWHGLSDPGPSPVGTIDYLESVQRTHPDAAKGVRLFLAPGVEHCGGGPGSDQPDTLTALEQWIEQDKAPATVIATRRDGSRTRPLCPFPQQARYDGKGDVNDPNAYRCQ